MASLVDVGDGLFTKISDTGGVPIEATPGLWNGIHPSEDKLSKEQQMLDKHKAKGYTGKIPSTSIGALPGHIKAVQQVPIGSSDTRLKGITLSAEANSQLEFSGQSIPKYDPGTSLPKAYQLPWHDNFKPPNGPT